MPYPRTFKELHHLSLGDLVSSTQASAHFDISKDYVARLCRQEKIQGILLGRLWFVNEPSLAAYLHEVRLKREAQRKALSHKLSQEYRLRNSSRKLTV